MGLVVAGGIKGQRSDQLAVFGEHPDVEISDQHKDPGAGEPASEADVVQATVVAKRDTVPVHLSLADVNGIRIPDAEAQGLLSPACRVKFSATGAQSTSACMQYDAGAHEFFFSWLLCSHTGNVTISVPVIYPGTTTKTTLSEQIVVTTLADLGPGESNPPASSRPHTGFEVCPPP